MENGCVYHTAYSIVWIPKYRKSILVRKVASRLENLFHEIADKYGLELLEIYLLKRLGDT